MEGADSAAVLRAKEYKADGNKAFVAGRYADAAKAYTIAMQLNPEEKSFYGNRSAAWSKLAQFEKALIDANKAVAFAPDNPKALLRRAVALVGLKMWVAAREDYVSIRKALPTSSDAAVGLAECDKRIARGGSPGSTDDGRSSHEGPETPTTRKRRTTAVKKQELLMRAQGESRGSSCEPSTENNADARRVSSPRIAPYSDPNPPPPPPPPISSRSVSRTTQGQTTLGGTSWQLC
eukprot:m.314662 g.314662  ORF g.314662 m.314662 type:complete len:235 (+) comp27505_c2_seq2:108-812(+)